MSRESFLRLYEKLPDAERKFAIVIINGKEITWETAYREIKQKTSLGAKIIEKLNKLGIL